MTVQIPRFSRSVCANLAEAYRKRDYHKHYPLKISDFLRENGETLAWLDFSLSFHYITEDNYKKQIELNEEVGKLLSYMLNNPDKFGVAPL